ncbi:ER membrane protein [Dirofilaria immitis]
MHSPAFTLRGYAKMILHAYKYPHRAVVGFLIGESRNNGELIFNDAIPVLHESASLNLALEAALICIDNCIRNGRILAGLYFCNQSIADDNLDPYAVRVAEKIISNYSNTFLVQIDNSLLGMGFLEPAIRVYTLDNKLWKTKRFTILNEEVVLPVVSSAVQTKLYLEIMDFENHLDNPINDHWNTTVNEKLEQSSWLNACS